MLSKRKALEAIAETLSLYLAKPTVRVIDYTPPEMPPCHIHWEGLLAECVVEPAPPPPRRFYPYPVEWSYAIG